MNKEPDKLLYKIILNPVKAFDDEDLWRMDVIKPTFIGGDMEQEFHDTYEEAMTAANALASTVAAVIFTLRKDRSIANRSYRYNYTPTQEELMNRAG